MPTFDEVLLESEERMEKTIVHLHEKLSGVRTGKASPSLVEGLEVDYYGTPTRMKEVASIATPEPGLIVINAYDPSALPGIEKAILAANLGVTPVNDGRVIRVPIPPLSEERRLELVKVAKRMTEEDRVAVRNLRRDANDAMKALQKSGDITEDDLSDGLKDVQKLTDDYIGKIDKALADREAQILDE